MIVRDHFDDNRKRTRFCRGSPSSPSWTGRIVNATALKAWTQQPPQSPVDPSPWAEYGSTQVVESVSCHARVQVSLSCQATLEGELVCFTTAASERGPALLRTRMRFELATATVLCEVLGPWACLCDVG